MKQICVIGVGYVGLVTAACFADLGTGRIVDSRAIRLSFGREDERPAD